MNHDLYAYCRKPTMHLLFAVVSCVGCTTWQANSTQVTPTNAWQMELREPSTPGQLFGTDARSREIEQNLGVR